MGGAVDVPMTTTTKQGKPRIAIPVPTSGNDAYNDRCWQQYATAVEAVGGEAVRVSLMLAPSDAATLISTCAAVLLPGSPADVHPQKYGQESRPETAAPDLAREATDELLLQDAFHLRKPLLGVCFGLQMMNVWRGGSLVQHLQTGTPHAPAADQQPLQHMLELQPAATLLRSFYAGSAAPTINSSHHQAVDRPGDGLQIAALSTGDHVVEALEGTEQEQQFVLGVQWHPERSWETDQPSKEIFTALVAAAHRWHLPHA